MALTSTQQRDLIKVGIGLFGAALGSTYLNEFALAIERGDSVSSIYKAVMASSFAQSSGLYPSYLSNEQFATRFVENLAGTSLAGDAKNQAIAYVKGQLDASTVTPDSAKRAAVVESVINLLDTIDAAEATFGAAAKQFDNRVTVATYYSIEFGGSATTLSGLQTVVNSVTNTTDVSTSTAIMNVINGSGSGVNGNVYTLTTSIDNLSGTSGNDTFNASTVNANATGTTINPGDNINGGAGIDTVNIAASGSDALTNVAAVTFTNVEKVLVSEFNTKGGGNSTIDMSLADSTLTTVGLSSSDSSGTLEVTGLKKVVDAEMKNGTNSLTLTFASGNTGTADVVNLAVSGQSASTFTANGIETINVNSTLVKSNVTLAGSTLAKVTVTGDTEVAVTLPATTLDIDASAATGKVTIDTEAVTLASITSAKGGAGSTDVIKIDEAVTASSKLSKISGFETLAISAAVAVNLDAALAGVSTIDMTKADAAATTLTLASGYTGATTVNITAGTGADTITNTANVALTVNGNVADAGRVAIAAGTGTTDVLNLYADNTATTLLAGVTGVETINILANKTTASTATNTITTDNANVASGKTLVVNASALTNAAAAFTFVGSAETDGKFSITGGAGNDAITSGNGGDTIDGGAGNDTVTLGTGADSVLGGAGNDTIVAGGNLTAADTIDGGDGTDTLSVSTITSSGAFANVKNVEKIAISTAASFSLSAPIGSALTLDLSNTSAQTVTLASGYTGDTTVILTGDAGSGDDVINNANVALTVKANEADLVAGSTLTGGTGVDTLEVTAGAGNANLSNVTLFETIKVLPNATTATETVTLDALAAVGAGKSITIDASALVNSSAAFTLSNVTASAGKFVVTGGAGNDSISLSAVTGNATVDGGAGNDSITAGSGSDSLLGGAGNDTFTMAANLTVLDTIDGGDGTDTIQITTYNAASLTNVKNVEVLAVTGANTAAIDSTANSFTSFNLTDAAAQVLQLKAGYTGSATVTLTGAAGDTVTNGAVLGSGKVDSTNSPLWANTTLTVVGNVTNFGATTTITGGTGADTLQMTADNNGSGADLTNVRAVETITIKASSSVAGNSAFVTVGNAAVVADGATLTVNAADLTATGATLSYQGQAIVGTGKQNVTGGANGDYIRTGSGADSIDGGNGADTILSGTGLDTITSGAGSDVIDVSTNSNTLEFATVTDFSAGDRLFFSTGGTGAGSTTLSKVSLSSAATLSDYINAAASGDGSTTATVKWFNFGGKTYVVQDRSNSTLFAAGTDRVIELQGELDLTDTTKAVLTTTDIGGAKTQTLTFASTGNAVSSAFNVNSLTFTQSSAADASWTGGAAGDTFTFGSFLTSADTVVGGGGADTLTFTDAGATNDLDNVAFTSASTITLGDAVTAVTTVDALINANTLTVNGSALTGSNTLTWNGAAETNGTFSVTGGAAGDTITGGSLADTISGGAGADSLVGGAGGDSLTGGEAADTITGGAGDDAIVLTETTAASDKVIFSGATTALNGADTITGFKAGDTTGDVLAFTSLTTPLANANTGTAITLATTVALATEGTSIAVANNKVYVAQVANVANVNSAANLLTALTDTGVLDAVDVAASSTAFLVLSGADNTTTAYVYGIVNDATAAVALGEISLVGTITLDSTTLTTSNFAFA